MAMRLLHLAGCFQLQHVALPLYRHFNAFLEVNFFQNDIDSHPERVL